MAIAVIAGGSDHGRAAARRSPRGRRARWVPERRGPRRARRRLAHLTNKHIRARIEAAGYKVAMADEREPTSTWGLAGTTAAYVQILRLSDGNQAEMMEQTS